MADPFQQKEQYPLNAVGPKGQHAFVGVESVYFTGTTGQVGTAFGIPGVTVTRTATGAYSVTYPVAHECRIIPGISAPTGHAYDITVTQNNPTSGTANFNITRNFNFVGTAAVPISGSVRNYNPTSGTVADLLFFVSPITKF